MKFLMTAVLLASSTFAMARDCSVLFAEYNGELFESHASQEHAAMRSAVGGQGLRSH